MKKCLLIAALVLCTAAASFSQTKGYEKFVTVGFGLDQYSENFISSLTFTNGFRTNDNLFLGGGFGVALAFFHDEMLDYDNNSTSFSFRTERNDQFLVPVFATLKYDFTQKNISPLVMIDLGYLFGKKLENKIDNSGIFINPSAGCNFKLKDGSKTLFVKVGAFVNQGRRLKDWDTFYWDNVKLKLDVGLRF